MYLFQDDNVIKVCIKNTNKYVRLAVEDLLDDFLRVSYLTKKPQLVDKEIDSSVIIEENLVPDIDPLKDESFEIKLDGEKIKILANTYLGTIWGIYTFSEKVLGISPCYLFEDLPIKKQKELKVESLNIKDSPKKAGFRGAFINDEDLLTGFRESGGKRFMDYPFYQTTVAESAMDMVVETCLRLKLNLLIPASFLDVDNPPEKALLDCVSRRGIFISQHHLEPLGLSHFTFENYCKKFKKTGEYSYINNKESLIKAWEYYAKKWSIYDNVVWQVGLRGKADRPVWEEENPTDKELKEYADVISNAIKEQKEIVLRATSGKAKYFSTTLWMEGSTLMEKGFLSIPKDTIIVFSDNGPNQMFGNDYDKVPRLKELKYGIYYHVQYYDIGPHLAPQTGLNKLWYNIKRTKQKGDDDYYILNVSNVREFTFEINAYSKMLWDFNSFSIKEYYDEQCAIFGEQKDRAKQLILQYFNGLPTLPTQDLQYIYANYFNYNYQEESPNVKNFIVKGELVMRNGSLLISYFNESLPDPLYEKMYNEINKVIPIYQKLSNDFEALIKDLNQDLANHVRVKWWLYTNTLLSFYRWYACLFEAKILRDNGDKIKAKSLIEEGISTLEDYLLLRKCAEVEKFENWYLGEIKINVKQKLNTTKSLLELI